MAASKPTNKSSRSLDPTGKGALFEKSVGIAPDMLNDGGRKEGKAALFSSQAATSGTVQVSCSSCDARIRTDLLDLGIRMLPSAYVPWKKFPHYMKCPACDQHAWVRLSRK